MADKKGSHSKRKHSASASSGSTLAITRRVRETPYQDINRIRRNILAVRETKGSLSPQDYFTDPSFASDMTSLAYVYSGDDKYEKAIFKRPHEFQKDPVFVGVGGICDEPFPWRHWKQRHWLHAALVTASLSVRHMEKIIPGYKNFEQGFVNDYTGAFHFNIWRFGEWVDIVVDDRLPMLEDRHLFCGPMGSAKELWGPLVEKAYAKCKKTYQSIEYGNTLDALTDLTGAVCEHFTPDVRPPRNLFRILVKSHMARSQMVCWRNEKRLTPNGFYSDSERQESQNQRCLHVVTAVTKFPTTDGRLVEMVRLKCPYPSEPPWHGRFSDRDFSSWESVNRDFMHRFQPVTKKDEDEYWMSMEDFRCNFGGLFIISSEEPFRVDELSLTRSYHLQDGWDYHSSFLTGQFLASPNNNRLFRRSSTPWPEDVDSGLLDSDSLELARRRTSHASIFSSTSSGHFLPFRSHNPLHHHYHQHHQQHQDDNHHSSRAGKKKAKNALENEEESSADTQSLFIKTNVLEKAKATSGDDPTVTGEAGHALTDLVAKKGFFSRPSHHPQHQMHLLKITRRKNNDLQRLAFAQNEAKRTGSSLKNVLQTGLANVKLTFDCKFDQHSDAYESSTDESPDVDRGDSSAFFPQTAASKPSKPNSHDQTKLGPCFQGMVKGSPRRKSNSPGDVLSTAIEKTKLVVSPRRSATRSPASPRLSHKSPKSLARSPRLSSRSPKSPARSSLKHSAKSPKPSPKKRNPSTPSPSLMRRMATPTNVAAVIGNVPPTTTTTTTPGEKPREAGSNSPAASRGCESRAPSSTSTPTPTPTPTARSSLTLPAFKPPKSPTPHGHRHYRTAPSTHRATSAPLVSPDSLKSPEIFSVSAAKDPTSLTLSIPGTASGSEVTEDSGLSVNIPESPPSSLCVAIAVMSSVQCSESENGHPVSEAGMTAPSAGATTSSTSNTVDGQDFKDEEKSASSSSGSQSSLTRSPRSDPSALALTDPSPASAFNVAETRTGSIDESFFQPILQQISSFPNSSVPAPSDSQTAAISAHSSSSQTANVPIQSDPQAAYRRAIRSVSSTSDTDSTHSSSDIFLHFKSAAAPTTAGAAGFLSGAGRKLSSGGGGGGRGGGGVRGGGGGIERRLSDGGGRGKGGSGGDVERRPSVEEGGGGGGGRGRGVLEEMAEEVEMEAKDKGCLLPVSASESRRPHSAPQSNLAKHVSSSSLSSLTQGHFRATKADYFRSEGRWRLILEVYDKWTRTKQSACRSNLDLHSRSQRHHLHVTRLEHPDEMSPPTMQSKRHVIVSLLQDYRHGAVTANSLLVPIGFCVYKDYWHGAVTANSLLVPIGLCVNKCKGAERDDKRHISRFQMIYQVHGEPEVREVTARLDLDPGYYFLVPFYRTEGHTGEYLLRVLTEDCPQTKAGCRVS